MSKLKSQISNVVLVAGALVLTACGGDGGGSSSRPPQDKVNEFVSLLNDKSYSDSYFSIVKRNTLTEGFVVVYSADTGYVAYDLKDYHVGDSFSSYLYYADYQPAYVYDTDITISETIYYAHTYNNDFFGTYAGDFAFDETAEGAKDLEKIKAVKEAFANEKMAETLTSEYGLSVERSVKVAKLVNNWSKLSKKRSLTEADANSFSKEMLGVDIKDAERAYKAKAEGNDTQVQDLIEDAAKANQTSPEHINALMEQLLTSNK
jgi:hypothetical protein